MFYLLPDDILFSILLMFNNINDLVNISYINRATYKLFDDNLYTMWGRHIYSNEFWNIANKRTHILSKPLSNMKMELLRINEFNNCQRKHGYEIWKKEDYYIYWKSMEIAFSERKSKTNLQ